MFENRGWRPGPLPKAEYVEDVTRIENMEPYGFVIGLDLGKQRDFTALIVDELFRGERVRYVRTAFAPGLSALSRRPVIKHSLVNLHRYPKGTTYPDINRSVKKVMSQLPVRERAAQLIVDGTGVGAPVVDAMREMGMTPVGITITAGHQINVVSPTAMNVPKSLLASAVDVVLAEDRLDVTQAAGASTQLKNELGNFRVKLNARTGSESMEAWREADHDDLVLAAALAIWRGETLPQPTRFAYIPRIRS